jgi:hypothetical protein
LIDIENLQFTRVKSAVSALCTECGTSDKTATTPPIAYLLFVQKDNPAYRRTIDSGSKENHVQPMIQIDVITQDSLYKAKQIIKLADAQMQLDGWERIFGPQPLSLAKPFRVVARYQAVVTETSPNNFRVYSN